MVVIRGLGTDLCRAAPRIALYSGSVRDEAGQTVMEAFRSTLVHDAIRAETRGAHHCSGLVRSGRMRLASGSASATTGADADARLLVWITASTIWVSCCPERARLCHPKSGGATALSRLLILNSTVKRSLRAAKASVSIHPSSGVKTLRASSSCVPTTKEQLTWVKTILRFKERGTPQ
jgi:hypothetical protein